MDWNNVDLNSHEVTSAIIDQFTFEDLLLLISCNVENISEGTVDDEFYEFLENKIEEIKDIYESNKKNIVKKALEERARK